MYCAALHNVCPWPEHNAAMSGGRSLSSRGTVAERIANAMRGRFGIRPRDRVAMMMMYDRPEFDEVFVAIGRVGAIAVPLNAKLDHGERTRLNACSGMKLMFVAPDFAETAARIADMVPELDIVLVAPSFEYDCLVAQDVGPVEPIWRTTDELAWIFYASDAVRGSKAAPGDRNLFAMIYSHLVDIRIV